MRIVVHHQYPQAPHGRRAAVALAVVLARLKHRAEVEMAAMVQHAIDTDLAAQQLHQLLADRQPQAGAAMLAGGRGIGLRERLEQACHVVRRHADAGVTDREMQHDALLRRRLRCNLDRHAAAGRGKFDGVVAQVDQDLPQPDRVALQAQRHLRAELDQELHALFLRLDADDGTDAV